jgi:ABC-2 type transport system ATP-binding protein
MAHFGMALHGDDGITGQRTQARKADRWRTTATARAPIAPKPTARSVAGSALEDHVTVAPSVPRPPVDQGIPPSLQQAGGVPVAPSPQPLGPPVVLMDHVSRRFGDVVGIDDISLAVPAGTILGVIGPSGSGKTTTIRVMSGGLAPTAGAVRVLGEDPRHFHRATRERIGYMPQSFVLYPDLTVAENVHFMGSLFGVLWRRRRTRTREALELVELWDVRGRRASQLSGGMQRRLALACTLVHEPILLFLDEPTAGVDPILRQRIWTELHRLRDAGCTLLVTTQHVGEADYCDSVALITEGQLAALAAPHELRRIAQGGDVLEVETEDTFDIRRLPKIDSVIDVRQRGPNTMLLVCDDAGAATPNVVEAFRAAGAEVTSSREYRPTFDEIFAILVERHAQTGGGAGSGGIPVAGAVPYVYSRPR